VPSIARHGRQETEYCNTIVNVRHEALASSTCHLRHNNDAIAYTSLQNDVTIYKA